VDTNEAKLDALGDPTRRAVLKLLRGGGLPVADIAREFLISRPAISQHLRVLKDAGLVTDSAAGTRRIYALNTDAFVSLRAYFDDFWTAGLSEFKKRAEERRAARVGKTGKPARTHKRPRSA
jgi:DNA-binding transcriptional ArsR family regulator